MTLRAAILLAASFAAAATPVRAGSAAGDWVAGHNSRVRLIAAPVTAAGGKTVLMAGIEIALDGNWKTYWRNPGDAGGVPPEFDFAKSTNIGKATVLFPAPIRLVDALGDSIGYKHSVLFPVTFAVTDPAKPVTLDVAASYGVCEKVCIPEEHELTLTLDPAAPVDPALSDRLAEALAAVPGAAAPGRPQLVGLKLESTNGKPIVAIDAQFPRGTAQPEMFVEAVDPAFLPQPEALKDAGDGHAHFRIDLSLTDDFKQPSGKQIRLTLVGSGTASEAIATIP